MRMFMLLAATLLCGACGSMEYRDTNAAVDANPLCTGSNSARDGQPSISTATVHGIPAVLTGQWTTRNGRLEVTAS